MFYKVSQKMSEWWNHLERACLELYLQPWEPRSLFAWAKGEGRGHWRRCRVITPSPFLSSRPVSIPLAALWGLALCYVYRAHTHGAPWATVYLADMQTRDLREEVGGDVELCLRCGEVHIGKPWEEGFSKGRQLNQVLEHKEEFFIWTRIEAFQKTALWETGTKARRQRGT